MSRRMFEIVSRVRAVLDGRLLLKDFYHWLAPYTWNNHHWGDQQAAYLANGLELSYWEYENGDYDQAELLVQWREMIAGLPPTYTSSNAVSYTWYSSSSGATWGIT